MLNKNWNGYGAFYEKTFLPKQKELKSHLKSVKNNRRNKAMIPFFIAISGVLLWAMSEWMGIQFIPYLAEVKQHYYWIVVVSCGILSVYFYFTGDEENQSDAELMDLIIKFRGWKFKYKPGKEFTLKSFRDDQHLFKALLDGNIGFLLTPEKMQDAIKVDLTHYFVFDNAELVNLKCSVDFTKHTGDEIQTSGSKTYFQGIFMKILLSENSGSRFAICPSNSFGQINNFNTDQLCAHINLPPEPHYVEVNAPYAVFSDGENRLIDPLMESIKQHQEEFMPVNSIYVYCDGEYIFLGLDYKQSLFELNLRDSDKDVEKFKSYLDYYSDWSQQLMHL